MPAPELIKPLRRIARTLLMASLDRLAILFVRKRLSGNCVLVVRTDAIGDFVLAIEAIKALVAHYRSQENTVVLLGNRSWSDWAQAMGLADEIWGIDTKRFACDLGYRWHWLRQVRGGGFDIVIQPTFSRMLLEGDSLVRASGAGTRIGSQGDCSNMRPWQKSWGDRWYTRLIAGSPQRLMELQRNAEFAQGLGLTDVRPNIPEIAPLEYAPAATLDHKRYAVLFPAATWSGRLWPSERFAEIGRRLAARGLRVVVGGGPGDHEQSRPVVAALGDDVVDMVGKTTLPGLAELLRGAAIAVSNETSALHIGAAVGTPVVCILGGGHFGRFAPYPSQAATDCRPLPVMVSRDMPCFGCNWQCIFARAEGEPVKCIGDISVEDVWDAIEKFVPSPGQAF